MILGLCVKRLLLFIIYPRNNTLCVPGYCVGGSNGEGPYLKSEEKLEMVSKIRSMIGKDRLLIAGTTCECKTNIFYRL